MPLVPRLCYVLYSSDAISFIFILFSSRIILDLVHYQTAVSHRISSVLRECSYINSATLTRGL